MEEERVRQKIISLSECVFLVRVCVREKGENQLACVSFSEVLQQCRATRMRAASCACVEDKTKEREKKLHGVKERDKERYRRAERKKQRCNNADLYSSLCPCARVY